uniref:Uncharacterized protein n=1 Tax=Ciona intestinalis TaxID=7719 RepID=F6PK68_CIOIN|nr:uncharacterized protein DDB_G0283697-like [Ciona intestinalis]|eukprot:XP_002129374.1 uncharacterized protein DDB_G0283697-like [Ciona intestinalis]
MGSGSSKVKKLKPDVTQTTNDVTSSHPNRRSDDANNNSSSELKKKNKNESNLPGMVFDKPPALLTSQALILGRQRLKTTTSQYALGTKQSNNNCNKKNNENQDCDDIEQLILEELKLCENENSNRMLSDVSNQTQRDVTGEKPIPKKRKKRFVREVFRSESSDVISSTGDETKHFNDVTIPQSRGIRTSVSEYKIELKKPLPAPRFSKRRIKKMTSAKHRNHVPLKSDLYVQLPTYTDLERQLMEEIEREFCG